MDSPGIVAQGQAAAILKSLRPDNFLSGDAAILAAAGLGFSYVASAPVLVFHAVRGSLLKVRTNVNKRQIACFFALIVGFSVVQFMALWNALNWSDSHFHDLCVGAAVFVTISTLFFGQLFILWLAIFREQDSFDYYDDLVQRRASTDAAGREYVESYRHLREHGNAFFIALLELLLGAALFYSPVPWGVILMVWVFPAAGVWFFGTLLESRTF